MKSLCGLMDGVQYGLANTGLYMCRYLGRAAILPGHRITSETVPRLAKSLFAIAFLAIAAKSTPVVVEPEYHIHYDGEFITTYQEQKYTDLVVRATAPGLSLRSLAPLHHNLLRQA